MTARPHPRWSSLALVAAGGAAGAAARAGVSVAVPHLGGVPVTIVVVNVVGAFLLGYLYEAVTRLGPGSPRATSLKRLLGTGFCGGFTTYSSLATDTATLVAADRPAVAATYALGTVVVGSCATLAGLATATRRARVAVS